MVASTGNLTGAAGAGRVISATALVGVIGDDAAACHFI